MKETSVVKSISELEAFATDFAATLERNERGATIVGLSGDLGSGKTAFVKAVAKALGIGNPVLSPTFVLAKFYDIPRGSLWSRLIHIDAYRIDDHAEIKTLRWEEIKNDTSNLVFIEWPERIGDALPRESAVLRFRFLNEGSREIVSVEGGC